MKISHSPFDSSQHRELIMRSLKPSVNFLLKPNLGLNNSHYSQRKQSLEASQMKLNSEHQQPPAEPEGAQVNSLAIELDRQLWDVAVVKLVLSPWNLHPLVSLISLVTFFPH